MHPSTGWLWQQHGVHAGELACIYILHTPVGSKEGARCRGTAKGRKLVLT